jgi:diadenosine tetraphosphate (Ap4A) HIT family hydrolase
MSTNWEDRIKERESKPECPFCSPTSVLYETHSWFAIADRDGKRNHILLVPRYHVGHLHDLDRQVAAELPRILSIVLSESRILRYRLQVNGPGFQHTKHLHVHLRG